MRLITRPFRYFYYHIAYQIRLTKIRYRYRPYYAIGWLLGDIMLRLMLIILPLILLLWEIISPPSLPQIPKYSENILYNFVENNIITIGGENPLTIESDETAFIAQNHYHLRKGLINIHQSGQKIRADDMLVQDNIITMNDNVSLQNNIKNFELNTAQMRFNQASETVISDVKSFGFMGNYRFEAIGFHYKLSPESLDLYGYTKFQSDSNTLIGKNGMVLALNHNRLSVNDVIFNDVEGTKMIANYADGVFDDNINYLKELHFSGNFAYHWRDNLIMGERAVIYFDKTQTADYMVARESIIATMPEVTATAEQAYINYATEQLEMCGDTEITTKRGRKITTPCAVFSLNGEGSFNLRQNKTYLQ
ncbi:MAG: hypothetical protein K0U39_09205 [Alphaproteobacteria bacterium]|nr:hypothetical protein [Alphaproteobacteria bacterium]